MVQNVVKEEVVEEQTVEPTDIVPVSEVLGEEAVSEQLENVVKSAQAVSLTYDWSPLQDSGQVGHAEAFIEEILDLIPELQASRSKGQNICLKFNGKKPVARFWFNRKHVTVNTMALSESGKAGYEPKDQSRAQPENGYSKKVRATIVKEIRGYIKARGFTVPAPKAEA